MSDDSTPSWLPPGQPPSVPLPTPVPSMPLPTPSGVAPSARSSTPLGFGPPTQATVSVDTAVSSISPSGEQSGRSKKVLVGAVAGVLALGAAGVFAATQLTASNAGGAETPEALGEAVMASLEQEDALGVIDLLLPGERETFREPMTELINELTRLDVLTDDASLSGLNGFDLVLDDRSVEVAPTNVDDITNITMTATATATVEGEALPIGELITDNFGDELALGDLNETESGIAFELPVTAVEQDGRWYLSGFYTIAENARAEAGILEVPASGIEPQGGDSPEGAIDVLLDGVERLDLSAVIAALNPNEAEALQRYAPIFLDDAQQQLNEAPLSWEVTDVAYDVSGSGSERSVKITSLRVEGTTGNDADGATAVPFSLELKDGCLVAEADGQSTDTCALETGGDDLTNLFAGIDGLDELQTELTDILADYEQPGITVNEVDGQWYVSPIGTGFDQVLALMRAVDRDEIERAADAITTLAGDVESEFGVPLFGTGDDGSFSVDVPASTLPPITETIPGETVPGDEVPGDESISAADQVYSDCMAGTTAAEVSECLQTNIASGLLPAYYLPIELKFLECGVGDVYIGIVPSYELTNEQYTAILTTANACFTQLIADGAVAEADVPPEYLRVECAEGRNPWNFDDPDNEEFFNRWLDCIYA